ncbi:MAG: 30S ribosomal protein S16 [Actinobacteria bacterium]|nr:30S ribosomal protein S16 [Actinomycetota bacterium]
MTVRIRLTRKGAKKHPVYRIIVADVRSPRDGRFIERIGRYDPNINPPEIELDRERYDHWIKVGAQPTSTVKNLAIRLARSI